MAVRIQFSESKDEITRYTMENDYEKLRALNIDTGRAETLGDTQFSKRFSRIPSQCAELMDDWMTRPPQKPTRTRTFPALDDLPPLAGVKLVRPRRCAAPGAPA